MKIKTIESKGIYLHNCNKSSMEKYIITLFRDKIASLPIAQNVLITNKETTSEEIQAFFHRAILCNYNTLFVVEINDSFSDFQQSIMNTYIDILLSHKNYEYNKQTKENVDKKSTNIYLDSCIYFIYNNYNKNIVPFIKEIEKFISKEENYIFKTIKLSEGSEIKKKELKSCSTYQTLSSNLFENNSNEFIFEKIYLKNILVIKSDIYGLRKSKEIEKRIKKEKTYFIFL